MATTRSRPRESSGPTRGGGNGRRPRRRRNPFWRGIVLTFQLITIVVLAAIAGAIGGLWYTLAHLPSSVAQIENYRPLGRTMIYSSDGVLLANIFQQNRQIVTIDKIPKDMQNATVAIEDSRFYSNVGIDVRGIGRALWKDVSGKELSQGGSTITQQLVRNLGIGGVTRQKTITRKIREALLAIQIERNYSKQQILEMYLNQVYYGSGAYGVQAAAETYFGKPAQDLDLAQCALLAGLPQRPTDYSPYVDKKAAKDRRDTVLGRMRDLGYITADQCKSAQDEPIQLIADKPPKGGSQVYHAPYFVDYVVKQLSRHLGGSDVIYHGGIRVETTLNWQMQEEAETDLREGIESTRWSGATQGALVAMDPQTGGIKAMVGGIDYNKSQYNIAAGARQPGSSFKPIIYTAALDSGVITENTLIEDEPISLPGANGTRWTPKNDDGRFRGPVSAKEAVALSINVAAVKVLRMIGVPTAIDYARMMGVTTPLAPYYTLALGSSAVSPLEMAVVYSTIDNQGQRPTPMAVTQVTDDTGAVVEDDEPQLVSTGIQKDALVQMSDMLRAVVTQGTAYHSFTDDNPPDAHGKTGTTQDHRDVWFDGYTKKLVCIVWAGHPSVNPKTHKPIYGLPMNHEAFGATITAPIWKRFMISALAIQARDDAKMHPPAKPKVVPAATTPAPAAPAKGTGPTAKPQAQTQPAANGADNSTNNEPDTSTDTSQPGPSDTQAPDQAPGDNTQSPTASPAGQAPPTGASDTTTVWIDDATGLRAPPNAPGAHQQTFEKGTEPTSYAPAYSQPSSPSPPSPARSTQKAPAAETSQPTHHQASTPAPQRYVTVTICAESGLRATKWCPETIDRVLPVGKAPTRYCNIHKPPPGEH